MNEPPEEVVEAARVVGRWFNKNLPSEDGQVPRWALGGVCSSRYERDVGMLGRRLESADEEIRKKDQLICALRGEIATLHRVSISRSVRLDAMRQRIEKLNDAGDAMAIYAHANDAQTWREAKEVKP